VANLEIVCTHTKNQGRFSGLDGNCQQKL
jgi:hypothetical protein